MPAQYETCFTINGSGGVSGVQLLREVTERITGELLSSTAGEDAPDVETGATESAGYTRVSAERNYPADPQYRVRLEVRLCTSGGALDAEVQSRFLSTTEAAPPELLAGPPRLLQFIASEFRCADGSEPLPRQPRYVTVDAAESFARESVLNPQRRLPILALSEGRNGIPALDPDRAQRTLLGVASVAVLSPVAATELTRYLGRWFSSSVGALQILWPGSRVDANGNGPRILYSRNAAAGKNVPELLRELQQACIANAPESDFDSAFSEARVSVILERNRLLETRHRILSQQSGGESTPDASSLRRELRKKEIAEREANRKWRNALTTVARLEQELAAANDAVAALSSMPNRAAGPQDDRDVTRQLRAENRELREERDRLRQTNARLNEDNQLLRQERQRRNDTGAYVLRLDCPHPGNVTILNYALNLYRDPMRRYIISNLGATDEAGLKEILRMSVEFGGGAWEKPEALIDVNDFHNIVADNRSYFEDSRNLARNLRQIKDVRNRAAHPPPGGIPDDYTQDGLARIAEALEAIGARQELLEVIRLRDRIHAN